MPRANYTYIHSTIYRKVIYKHIAGEGPKVTTIYHKLFTCTMWMSERNNKIVEPVTREYILAVVSRD